MRPGEKAILPVWFRTGLVLALLLTLYTAFTHSYGDKSSVQSANDTENQLSKISVASRNLNFVDLEQGAVSVVNADNGQELLRLYKGEDGFMRSVMRGLVRERKSQNIGPAIAFELILWDDGLLSLIDPATSRRVELSAFGSDNVAAFSRLLPTESTTESSVWL